MMKKLMNSRTHKLKNVLLVAMLFLASVGASAQGMTNTAFKSGEYLSYNLYFNWKFVWIKAGNASFSTTMTRYKGHNAYKTSLTAKTNARADKFYVIRDILTAYCTGNLVPLFYTKNTHEGNRRNLDEVTYQFSGGKCHMKLRRRKTDGVNHYKNVVRNNSFDMLSIFLRARSWNPSGWRNGYKVGFNIVDGKNCNPAYIQYGGKTNVDGDNNRKYRCLKLSYYENEGKGYKRIATFYVTDDQNHIPILIDLNLKFGSAKAKIVNIRGNRYPIRA